MSDDVEKLALGFAKVLYANNTIGTLATGIQIFMFLYSLSVFLETPRHLQKGRIPYMIISFIILAISIIGTCIGANIQFNSYYHATSGLEFFQIHGKMFFEAPSIAGFWLVYLNIAIADGLLLYRCYIIWKDKLWVLALPAFVYLSSTATNIFYVVHLPRIKNDPVARENDARIYLAVILLTTIFNILATSLIAFRLFRAHRNFSAVLPGRNMRVYKGAATIIIESALTLTIPGIASAIITIINVASPETAIPRNLADVGVIVDAFYGNFVSLAPQMIIFRVTIGRSFVRHDETLAHAPNSMISQPLAFNHGHDESYIESSTQPGQSGEKTMTESA
ncbi:hypothetical protein CC1G_08951 [Coprinopsis cinerea okayama7|uniref:Uncharacterized protein n=1 Tax=Coprinopsis cinerea (strain Okayama-7 / 130 / ATCC MYA-4618 / FGSC 9003) TaxID=240176 RepID=A8P4Q4_COPC7|nr:hypothetical protein CC1G_08951 [Coprinopsis cinerea okayama7\|eukprot:XP_001838787.2 hypothetical protein CC1G_08951 [Coprinopsis cinerea okayama7\